MWYFKQVWDNQVWTVIDQEGWSVKIIRSILKNLLSIADGCRIDFEYQTCYLAVNNHFYFLFLFSNLKLLIVSVGQGACVSSITVSLRFFWLFADFIVSFNTFGLWYLGFFRFFGVFLWISCHFQMLLCKFLNRSVRFFQ